MYNVSNNLFLFNLFVVFEKYFLDSPNIGTVLLFIIDSMSIPIYQFNLVNRVRICKDNYDTTQVSCIVQHRAVIILVINFLVSPPLTVL